MDKTSAKQTLPRQTVSLAAFGAEHGLTRAERKERGRGLRKELPFKELTKVQSAWFERDPLPIIEASNFDRVKELIPIRYGRMLASPFTFYRGTAALMARDLSQSRNSGVIVQCCGDCHVLNFGGYATPERNIAVDIVDFDETMPAPWEWDVKRLAASLVIAVQSVNLPSGSARAAAVAMGRAYRERMREYARMKIMDVWYDKFHFTSYGEDAREAEVQLQRAKRMKEAIRQSSPEALSNKYVQVQPDGQDQFKHLPPLLYRTKLNHKDEDLRVAYQNYTQTLSEERRFVLSRYQVVDMAMKVVGIGSVGTRCMIMLLSAADGDRLILQVKEARPSVFERYAGKSGFANQGQRVVVGQRLMQSASDLFLGWSKGPGGRDCYIRQFRDAKISPNPLLWDRSVLMSIANATGEILAKGHARSGDPALLRGYLGKSADFEESLADFAMAYAKQNEKDYERFRNACRSGKLKADLGNNG